MAGPEVSADIPEKKPKLEEEDGESEHCPGNIETPENGKNNEIPEMKEETADPQLEHLKLLVEFFGRLYKNPPSAPALSIKMINFLSEKIVKKSDEDELVEGFNMKLTKKDLLNIYQDDGWLQEKNIDFYLKLIQKRSEDEGGNYPSVFTFPCFFFPLYASEGDYYSVKNCTNGVNIFEKEIVYFPVMIGEIWRLVAFSFPNKYLKCCDTLSRCKENETLDMKILKIVGTYILAEYKEKVVQPEEDMNETFKKSNWNLGVEPKEIAPQQFESNDCGIFILQMAEYLARKKEFDFSQENVLYFRKRMVIETLSKKLLL